MVLGGQTVTETRLLNSFHDGSRPPLFLWFQFLKATRLTLPLHSKFCRGRLTVADMYCEYIHF